MVSNVGVFILRRSAGAEQVIDQALLHAGEVRAHGFLGKRGVARRNRLGDLRDKAFAYAAWLLTQCANSR